jgi:endoglucanase
MKLLEQLALTPGVPGREHRVRKLIDKEIKGLFDEVRTDALGSLICVRKARPKASGGGGKSKSKPTKIMLAAHMDQIGFLVSFIDDKGFLRVNPVGGFDTRNLFARIVTVCPDVNDPKKDLPAVMNPGGKPVHIASPEDRKKVPELEDLTIDLGLPADEVKKKVKLGDMVVLKAPFQQVGNTFVSQCMDNRVACWIAIEAIKKLDKAKHHDCEVHCVFTVQEEVGLRGAGTAAYGITPDIGIAIDTTLCCDTPGVPCEMRVSEQGKGAALTIMDGASIADLALLEEIESVAKKEKIPHQRSILPKGGTDAGTIQRAAAGARTFTLSCPTRYIHTVTEMVHETELNACRDLLAAYLAQSK